MTEEWQELIGAELAGFRLAKLIGVGGQAAVFLGINDARRGQRRAIKVVVPLLARDRTFEARFLEEAEVLERLSHPNIVAFRDVRIAPATRGHESIGGGARFMALELELLEGHSLREVADAGYELKPWKVLEWIAQAADGLAAAHALGVIHRDIKPGNIFLCDDGAVKIIDFGIARAISRADAESGGRLTKTGHIAGTTLFIAPELWRRADATPAVDIYALGLTLAQLLLRRHPFFGLDGTPPYDAAIMMGHLDDDLREHLRTEAGPLPRTLQDIILRLCARDPAERPPSAEQAAREMRQVAQVLERESANRAVASHAIPSVQDLFTGVRRGVERFGAFVESHPAPAAKPPGVNSRQAAAKHEYDPLRRSRIRIIALGLVATAVIALAGITAMVQTLLSPASDPLGAGAQPTASAEVGGAALASDPIAPAELLIRTDIASGHLFVDGEDYGPISVGPEVYLELPGGRHRCEVRVGGTAVVALEVSLQPGITTEILLAQPSGHR